LQESSNADWTYKPCNALCTQNWAIYMDGFTNELAFYYSAETFFVTVIKFTVLTFRAVRLLRIIQQVLVVLYFRRTAASLRTLAQPRGSARHY
jgi:hypothetical protein